MTISAQTESVIPLVTEPKQRAQEVMKSHEPFALTDEFLFKYVNKQPKWGPVGYVTYKRTYARPLNTISDRHRELAERYGLETSEEWWLTVCRVVEGTYQIQQRWCKQNRLRWSAEKAQRSAQEMYRLIFNFKFTPPGRGLWMMGAPYVEKVGGAALNNCAFISTANIDQAFAEPFTFLMDMSMLGVGVGFDTKGAGRLTILKPSKSNDIHVVSDSREGWVDLLRRVLNAYVGIDTLPADIDYSLVRPYGTPILGFGGTAAGPGPLQELYQYVTGLLDSRIGQTITSSDIVDLMNMIGRCVVAGNVRRSAELSLGDPTDMAFLNLKNYDLHPEACAKWRWASNNSIGALVGMDYSDVAMRTALNGEPGYVWLDNAKRYGRMGRDPDNADMGVVGVNPCSEQSLESHELCCLAEVFPSNHDSYEELERTLKMVYLYTKTVTLVPTHNEQTNEVMLRNRRIGVSMTGIIQAMKKFGRRQFLDMCDKGYKHLRARDDQYSRWLCVPKSVKITSVKPSGTVSLLAGVTPGIHFPHSEYYNRVIRFASDSPLLVKLRSAGYRCVDLAPREPNTVAVYFPVQEKYFDRSKDDVSIWEQLELAAQMQQYWADNQVSITVTFKRARTIEYQRPVINETNGNVTHYETVTEVIPGEEEQIKHALSLYDTRLKGVSFLPNVDHGYEHAPYQKITKEEYEQLCASIQEVDLSETLNEVQDKFCDGESCILPTAQI